MKPLVTVENVKQILGGREVLKGISFRHRDRRAHSPCSARRVAARPPCYSFSPDWPRPPEDAF